MIKNKLKIYDSKTEFIISDLKFFVVFDQYLTFHDYISGICRSTHLHLRNIGRIRNLLTFDATAQLIHALITTRLDFCNSNLYNFLNTGLKDYNGYKTRQHVC